MPRNSPDRQMYPVIDSAKSIRRRETTPKEIPVQPRSTREDLDNKRVERISNSYAEIAKMYMSTKGQDVGNRINQRHDAIVADVIKSQVKDVEKALHERIGLTAFATNLDQVQTDVLRSYLDGLDEVDSAHALMTKDKSEESKAMWRQAKEAMKSIEADLAADDVDISQVDLGRKASRDALRTEKLSLIKLDSDQTEVLRNFASISMRTEQLTKDRNEVIRMIKAEMKHENHGSTLKELNKVLDYIDPAIDKGKAMLEERTIALKETGIEPSQYNLGTKRGLEAMYLEIPGSAPDPEFLKKDFSYTKTLARLREEKEPIALEGHRDLERTGIQIIDERYPDGNVPRGKELEGYDIPRPQADIDWDRGIEITDKIARVDNAPDFPAGADDESNVDTIVSNQTLVPARDGMSGEATYHKPLKRVNRDPEGNVIQKSVHEGNARDGFIMEDTEDRPTVWKWIKQSPVAKKVGRFAGLLLTSLGLAKGIDTLNNTNQIDLKPDGSRSAQIDQDSSQQRDVIRTDRDQKRSTVDAKIDARIQTPPETKPTSVTPEVSKSKQSRPTVETEAYPHESGDIAIERVRDWDIESILSPENMSDGQAKELVKGDPKKLEAALKIWENIQGKAAFKKMKTEEQKAVLASALADIKTIRDALNPKHNPGVEMSKRIDLEKRLDDARSHIELMRTIRDLQIPMEPSTWETVPDAPIDLNVSSR